jgi:hypothetical protein
VHDLVRAVYDYVRNYNRKPQPWVASASRIIRKVNRYKETSETEDQSSFFSFRGFPKPRNNCFLRFLVSLQSFNLSSDRVSP